MLRVLVVFVALVVGHQAIARDRFLCIAEQSTGFRWDGQRWTIPQTIVHEKFLVEEVRSQQIDGKTYNFEVKPFRENWVSLWCNREVLRDGTVDSRIICG